jgi:hypothetical protein
MLFSGEERMVGDRCAAMVGRAGVRGHRGNRGWCWVRKPVWAIR